MDSSPSIVNSRLANLLPQLSLRALFTIAHYNDIPLRHQPKPVFAARLAMSLAATPLRERLRLQLNYHDLRLLIEMCRGFAPASLELARFPWQLQEPRPPLADLLPLEKLMALGLVLPIYAAGSIKLVIPAHVAAVVQAQQRASYQLPSLPAGPALSSIADDAVTLLACLNAQPARHSQHGHWPAHTISVLMPQCPCPQLTSGARRSRLHLLHHLLHAAGYLTLADGRCRPAPGAPLFLEQPPLQQLRLLLNAWQAAPLESDGSHADFRDVTGDWPSLLDQLFTYLMQSAVDPLPLTDVLATWQNSSALTSSVIAVDRADISELLPATVPDSLIIRLLRGPLYLLGLVDTDGSSIALSQQGRVWLRDPASLITPLPQPHLDDLVLYVPRLAAAELRYNVASWSEHHCTEEGYRYAFTATSVRRGATLYGSVKPLLAVLQMHFPVLPTALRQLLHRHAHRSPLRLTTASILSSDDQELLSSLLVKRRWRRHLGPRLGPHAVEVRHEKLVRRALLRDGLLADESSLAPTSTHHEDDTFHLVLALRLAISNTPTYAAAFARLAAGLIRRLTVEQRARLDDLLGLIEQPAPGDEPLSADSIPESALDAIEVRRRLQRAIETASRVRIRYYTASRHAISWRVIQPIALHREFLDAFCHSRSEERTFRLDRILALQDDGAAIPADTAPTPPPSPTGPRGAFLLPDYGQAGEDQD